MQTIKKIFVFIIMLTRFLSNSKSRIVYMDVNPDSLIDPTYNPSLNNYGIYNFTFNYYTQSGPLCLRGCNHDPPIISFNPKYLSPGVSRPGRQSPA